ncbi:hypothetical protein POTOM_031227 [Populus tomentosa]|uniref:Uncharacterized protein n=1 Tax=Populus tomentosa TaxID=118781 RepID=A0A8X7ZA74_POPTO|nr:hypothetical protein POTOM_031227 [Populus tomentosa]
MPFSSLQILASVQREQLRLVIVNSAHSGQTEARQENGGDEVTRYLPHPTTESIPSNKQVDSWFLFSDVAIDFSPTGNAGKTIFARSTGGFGLRLSPGSPAADDSPEGISSTSQPGVAAKLECQHPASETHTRIINDSVTVP